MWEDTYLLTVIRYIHKNPVKAAVVNNPEQYRWSSCATYYKAERQEASGVDTKLILGVFSVHEELALERFQNFMEEGDEDQCLGHVENRRLDEREAYQLVVELLKGEPVSALQTMESESRNQIMRQLRYDYGLGLRQLSRVTGLPLHIVRKV